MGELSTNLLTALRSPNAAVRLVAEIDFVTGTERWSKQGINSPTLGPYEQRIAKWGAFSWHMSTIDGSIAVPETTITINDQARSFDRRVSAGERLRGIAVRVKLAERSISPADWFVLFDGLLIDWDRGDGLSYSLKLRYDDSALSRPFPQVTIDPADWPNAPRDNYGKPAPVVVGRHDSSGFGSRKGAVDAVLVDSVNHGWIISYGRCMAVSRYFDGDTQITSGITLNQDYQVNGRRWTYVQFTAGSAPSSLRVDCVGVDSVGDGSGFLIELETDVLLFALCNFVFAQNTTGDAWSFSNSHVDWGLGESADQISARFDGSETAETYIGRWLKYRTDARVFWKPNGKLAFISDAVLIAPYSVYPYDVLIPPDVRDVTPSWPREDPVGRLFAPLASGSERLELADAFDPNPAVDQADFSAGPDYV